MRNLLAYYYECAATHAAQQWTHHVHVLRATFQNLYLLDVASLR